MKILLSLCAAAISLSAIAQTTEEKNSSCDPDTKPSAWGNTQIVTYPTTKSIFYGSEIDTSREWNICKGDVDGGVEVHMLQQIVPIQNCPGDYAVVRVYTLPDGTVIKRQIKRLSDGPVPI